jgi:hypothetical protein
MASVTKYFRPPLLTSGMMNWDYYYLGSQNGVTTLTSDSNYPKAPQTNGVTTAFDTDQITGGDLNNNPIFGSLGDNYGDVLSGWITPSQSGQYTFFIASDDASELWLSPSSDPSAAVMIANEPSCCNAFIEPSFGLPQTSTPQTLTSGTPYFIKALHVEGGGGDYVKVAWRISTDSTSSTNLPPIPASFLSAYAPVPPPQFATPVLSGGTLTITWSSYQGILQESTDLVTWTAVAGNPNPLVIPNVKNAGPSKFYRIAQ